MVAQLATALAESQEQDVQLWVGLVVPTYLLVKYEHGVDLMRGVGWFDSAVKIWHQKLGVGGQDNSTG